MPSLERRPPSFARFHDGLARLRDGTSHSHAIGPAPRWRTAFLFNGLAVLILAVAICLVFFDAPIALTLRTADLGLVTVFRSFTDLAKSDWMLIGSGALGLMMIPIAASTRSRVRAIAAAWAGVAAFVFLAVAGSGIAVNILKPLFGRGRPRLIDVEGTFVFNPLTLGSSFASFPSGHATTAFAFAAALALMVPRLRIGLYAIAALVALSRVIVGSHYLSDVIAGAALGAAFSYGLAHVFHARGLVFAVRKAQWDLKAPRVLAAPLRRVIHREPPLP